MRILRIAYRASFEFPKAETPLNPSGWRCPGEVVLEVFESAGGKWKSRGLDGKEIKHWAWRAPSAIGLQGIIEDAFEKQLKPWVPMGNAGDGLGHRELKPDELVIKGGKVYVLEQEDRKAKA
jgi:hypothetical protein